MESIDLLEKLMLRIYHENDGNVDVWMNLGQVEKSKTKANKSVNVYFGNGTGSATLLNTGTELLFSFQKTKNLTIPLSEIVKGIETLYNQRKWH